MNIRNKKGIIIASIILITPVIANAASPSLSPDSTGRFEYDMNNDGFPDIVLDSGDLLKISNSEDKNATDISELQSKYNTIVSSLDDAKNQLEIIATSGTATAANISKGKTAWVNGELITGTGEDNDTAYNAGSKDSVKNVVYSIYHNSAKSYTISGLSGGCSGGANHEHGQYHSNSWSTQSTLSLYENPDKETAALNTITFSLSTSSSCGDKSNESGAGASASYRIVTDTGTQIASGGTGTQVINLFTIKNIGDAKSITVYASGSISYYANGEGCNGYASASSTCSNITAAYLPISSN